MCDNGVHFLYSYANCTRTFRDFYATRLESDRIGAAGPATRPAARTGRNG